MVKDLIFLIDATEHNILRSQCPSVYGRVARLVASGRSTAIITLFFSRAPRMYPALLRRIASTADHLRRQTTTGAVM